MKKRWAVLLVVLILAVAIFQGIISSPVTEERPAWIYQERESHLSAYSSQWSGLSDFRELLEEQEGYQISSIISNPLILEKIPRPNETLLITVGVEKQYDPIQSQAILEFVKRGGRVLIMDDFGQATSLSRQFGIEFTGKQIWSLDFEKNVSFIKRDVSFDGEDYSLLFNGPSVLEKAQKDTIFDRSELIFTTKETWIDNNQNGRIDMMEGDAQERLPMVMTASLNGFPMVMCISDASLFINDMLDKDDNQAFAMAVVEHLIGSRDNVNIIFDESRHIQDSTPKNILYNFENAYVYLIHIFFVTETGSDTINMVLQVGKVVIIGIFFYVFSLVYVGTKNPRRYRSRYDPTYHVEYEFGGYNRTIRLYSLINSAIQERFKLIFVDAEHVYDSETKQVHSLKDRKFLRGLLRDPVLEKFYMKPEKDYSLKAISEIHQQLMILRAHEEVYE